MSEPIASAPSPYDSLWDEKLQRDYKAGKRGLASNRQSVNIALPPAVVFAKLPDPSGGQYHRFTEKGVELLRQGKLGVIHLSGGLATRFGQIKATYELAEFGGRMRTFLELKIGHVLWACNKYGGAVPCGLMNSPMTEPVTNKFLCDNKRFGLAEGRLITYVQSVLRRKMPVRVDIDEFFSDRGRNDDRMKNLKHVQGKEWEFCDPIQWAPGGHFDAIASLIFSRALGKFLAAGVEYLQISNIDNLAAMIDPAILGMFGAGQHELMVEVALKKPGDRGGIPVLLDSKGVVLMEEFALPKDFDATKVQQFNTATYWIRTSRILKFFGLSQKDLKVLPDAALIERVRRVRQRIPAYTILKEVEGFLVVQHEQLLGDLTKLYLEDTGQSAAYLLIDTDKRFIPVKTKEDLKKEASRIRAVLEGRVSLR